MSTVTIVAVGHGNCSIINSQGEVAIVDIPRRGGALRALSALDTRTISHMLISHADSDHMDNACSLLLDERWTIKNIYVNPDPLRRSKAWGRFLDALMEARTRGTIVHSSLTCTSPGNISVGAVDMEVLSPNPVMAIAGPGGRLLGTKMVANSLSAVIRVRHDNNRVLLCGDLDHVSLQMDDLDNRERVGEPQMRWAADTLVYPHHGGSTGKAPGKFVENILAQVRPEWVIFSNGRGGFDNPRPEIVAELLRRDGTLRLTCTGLSRRCAELAKNPLCAGSITIDLESGGWMQEEDKRHQEFLRRSVPSPMCRTAGDDQTEYEAGNRKEVPRIPRPRV